MEKRKTCTHKEGESIFVRTRREKIPQNPILPAAEILDGAERIFNSKVNYNNVTPLIQF